MSLALAPAARPSRPSTVLLESPHHPLVTTVLLGLTSAIGFVTIWLALVPDASPHVAGRGCSATPARPHCSPAAGTQAVSRHAAGRPAARGR
jgi:hypothetical protein